MSLNKVSRRVEDYLKAIYDIMEEKGYAKIKDLSNRLNVKPPSVTEMINRLSKMGFVNYEKYGVITLTEEGKRIAKSVKTRHDTFVKLLEILSIPKEIAERDAHELEHRLHPKTIEQFTKFVDFLSKPQSNLKIMKRWNDLLKKYNDGFSEDFYKC